MDSEVITEHVEAVIAALATEWGRVLSVSRSKKTRVRAQLPSACMQCKTGGGCTCPVQMRLNELKKHKRFSVDGITAQLQVSRRQFHNRATGKLPSTAAITSYDNKAEAYLATVFCADGLALEIDTDFTNQFALGDHKGFLHFVKQDYPDFQLKWTGCNGAMSAAGDELQFPNFYIPGLEKTKHILVRGVVQSEVRAIGIRALGCCAAGTAIDTHALEPRCDSCAAFRSAYLKAVASAKTQASVQKELDQSKKNLQNTRRREQRAKEKDFQRHQHEIVAICRSNTNSGNGGGLRAHQTCAAGTGG
jgi:hypothetical protein